MPWMKSYIEKMYYVDHKANFSAYYLLIIIFWFAYKLRDVVSLMSFYFTFFSGVWAWIGLDSALLFCYLRVIVRFSRWKKGLFTDMSIWALPERIVHTVKYLQGFFYLQHWRVLLLQYSHHSLLLTLLILWVSHQC